MTIGSIMDYGVFKLDGRPFSSLHSEKNKCDNLSHIFPARASEVGDGSLLGRSSTVQV